VGGGERERETDGKGGRINADSIDSSLSIQNRYSTVKKSMATLGMFPGSGT